jgi:SagB-type dehydrogenase family enzyme
MAERFDALSYSIIDLFEGDDHSTAQIFHESTKLTRKNYAAFSRRTQAIAKDPQMVLMMTRGWKTYAGAERLALPEIEPPAMPLTDALHLRRSVVGKHAGGPVSLAQLGGVLRWSYGLTREAELPMAPGERMRFRAAPSAGGLYPLEIYPIALDVTGCAPGVYHYNVLENALDVVRPGAFLDALCTATAYEDLVRSSAALIAVTAVLPRTMSKYQLRGYRFLSQEVGALVQNLYLTATAYQLGTCAVGGFLDDEVGALLDVDNYDEQVMILFSLGRR